MESIADILSDNGLLSQAIDDFAARQMQQQMAESILQAILDGESIICEAGTGTGKTYAYLVPVLMADSKVLISTGTKHLQDQIYHRDLPTVHKALKSTASIALLKGRANYLCLYRHRFAHELMKSPKLQHELNTMQHWVQKTQTGDLTEVLADDSAIRPWVSSTTDNCLGQECEDYEDCFVLKARKRAARADVIVVNHHLLLSDMALRETGFGELLPNIDTIVFDEAHQLPELATQFFGQSFSTRQCLQLSDDSRTAYQNEACDIAGFMEVSYELDKSVGVLRNQFHANEQKIEWQMIVNDSKLLESLQSLLATLKKHADLIESIHERGKELDHCYQRNLQLCNRLSSMLDEQDKQYVQWLEIRGKGILLHQTPLDISNEFQNRIKQYQCSCIYTSATLAVGKKFDHFSNQLGLLDVPAKQWPGPFDYQQQTLLYLPRSMPLPSMQNYTEAVVEQAIPVLTASKGRAFLLFTSHRALKEAAELIKSKLSFPCFIQGDAPKMTLIEQFRSSQNGLLLGTSSFWEGVDVKGSALSCVIIDKLPFAMPDDPVLKARGKLMEGQGKNMFMEYQLPQAVIALKQGVGRLIRDVNDYGVLMLCDPRLLAKSYGKIFLRSLPAMPLSREIDDVEFFFTEREENP